MVPNMTLQCHHPLYPVSQHHRLPFTLHSQTKVAPPPITGPPRPQRTDMLTWIALSRGWGSWGLQTELLLGRILMEYQWPIYRPSLRCLRLRDTQASTVLASIWGFTVRLWGPMDWMKPKWLCFSLCPWVVWHNDGLLHWMYHAARLGMIWTRSSWDSLHLILSLTSQGES